MKLNDINEKYEELMLDMEVLSHKTLKLVKEAKSAANWSNDVSFDWNLAEEIEFIAEKYDITH